MCFEEYLGPFGVNTGINSTKPEAMGKKQRRHSLVTKRRKFTTVGGTAWDQRAPMEMVLVSGRSGSWGKMPDRHLRHKTKSEIESLYLG